MGQPSFFPAMFFFQASFFPNKFFFQTSFFGQPKLLRSKVEAFLLDWSCIHSSQKDSTTDRQTFSDRQERQAAHAAQAVHDLVDLYLPLSLYLDKHIF